MFENRTWEFIVQPEQPIPLSELEIQVTEGEPLNFSRRMDLYDRAMQYWNEKQVESVMVRAHDLIVALQTEDRTKVARMQRQIGGIDPKVRFCRGHLDDKKLYLSLAATNYADFIGTNEQSITNPEFRSTLMQAGLEDYADQHHYFANALAVCALPYGFNNLTERKDPYAAIGFRSNMVLIYPNVPHVIGGYIDVKNGLQRLNIGGHIRTELREEIGLSDNEMGEAMFYGIVRQIPSRAPEIVLGIPIYVSQTDLEKRWQGHALAGKYEHRNINYYSVSQLPAFLEEWGTKMVPSGCAAVELFLMFIR